MNRLKIIILVIGGLITSYFGAKVFRSMNVIKEVTVLKTNHFIISYKGIYKEEAKDIANHLEQNYDKIRLNLNDPDHNIIHVFVHPTQTDFNKATGLLNSSANGTSRGPNEFHIIWSNWFNSLFPSDPIKTAIHEYTHCVQLNILINEAKLKMGNLKEEDFDQVFEKKFLEEYPQWFWEAICDYEAGIVNKMSVKYGMNKNLTLKELNTSNQIYNVGYTIIDYIVEKWGKEKLPMLITSYVDIQSVLGVSESDFEAGWVKFVNEKY